MFNVKEGPIPYGILESVEPSQLPLILRNGLLSLPLEDINYYFPGVQSGDYLRKKYDPEKWMPNDELRNAMLFAGQDDLEGLKRYTIRTLEDNSHYYLREFGTFPGAEDNNNQTLRIDNMFEALGIVEEFMDGEFRRTGEESIAHIYRTLLRTIKTVNHYNTFYNRGFYHGHFRPQVAEVAYLAAILHDFTEDEIVLPDGSVSNGRVLSVDDTDETDFSSAGVYLLIENNSEISPGQKELTAQRKIKISPFHGPFLVNSLKAMKSSHVKAEYLMTHLESQVKKQESAVSIHGVTQRVLKEIPHIVKAADRRDNQDTYFFAQSPQGIVNSPLEKLIGKAQESYTLFKPLEEIMDSRQIDDYTSIEVRMLDLISHHKLGRVLHHAVDNPGHVQFLPSWWAKKVLTAHTPSQMYGVPMYGGLPQII